MLTPVRIQAALLGVLLSSALTVPARAASITFHRLPSGDLPATSIIAAGPSTLITGGVAPGRVDATITTGATLAVTPGPVGPAADAITLEPGGVVGVLSGVTQQVGGTAKVFGAIQDLAPGGVVTRFRYPDPFGLPDEPLALASGREGAVWAVNEGSEAIDRIGPDGEFAAYPLPPGSGPDKIVAGPENSMWFTNLEKGTIGQITASGATVEHPIPDGDSFGSWGFSGPSGIAIGPDGAIWFTEQNVGRIGRMTAGGELQEFAIPRPSAFPRGSASVPQPRDIVAGPDGAMWFTDPGDDSIGRVSLDGEVLEYPIVSAEAVAPDEIVALGSELWFTEIEAAGLGSVDLSAPTLASPKPAPAAQIGRLLARQLVPAAPTAALETIRRRDGVTLGLRAPEAGWVVIDWHLTVGGRPGAARSTLIARGGAIFTTAGARPLDVRLTSAGRRLLRHATRVTVTIRAEFIPTAGGEVTVTRPWRLAP